MNLAVALQRLARTPAWLVDILIAGRVAGWVLYRMASVSGPGQAAPDAFGYGIALSMAAALLVRRLWPLAVLLWMLPAWFVYHVNGYLDGAPGPAVWVDLYSGAAAERRRGVFLAAKALLVLDAGGRVGADGASPLDTAMDSSAIIFVAALHVSPATARTHVHRAMAKLDARDRAQLVVLAYQTGLVG